ncbi:MAG: ribulose-phosphate 3-epimerase [Clostridia bacterium]|nr:ribulose-phosphate 3-epimerase [Clostridia bacterium]
MIQLAPSILSADFAKLYEDIRQVEKGGAQLLHVDVMDGHFVPNITLGPPIVKSLNDRVQIPLDVHLMIENPDQYIEKFNVSKTEIITVHAEACVHLHRTVEKIKSLGVKAGVALNPSTSLDGLDYILDDIDMVLIMTVNPGFGGQSFIPVMYEKINQLKQKIQDKNLSIDIQVDGGINLDNVGQAINAGANIIVAGSAVFKAEDICEQTKKMLQTMNG